MNVDLAALPDDVATLQWMVRALAAERATLSEAQAEIERLRLIMQKLQRSQFGQHAERLHDDQLQFGFEDLEASRGPKPKDVLERLSNGHPMSRLDDMLPWNWAPSNAAA